MIPVQFQPESNEFDRTIRQPGRAFLASTSAPIRWQNREYWRTALPALRRAYGGYCAYLAMKIPETVGNPTVDHFLPRKHYPNLAYEWSNFRLASALINARKKSAMDLLDPFELAPGWFVLAFPSLLTLPAETLQNKEQKQVEHTIEVLKLNQMDVRQSRKAWVTNFALGKFSFEFLTEEQPFVAHELQRQKLDDRFKLRQLFI